MGPRKLLPLALGVFALSLVAAPIVAQASDPFLRILSDDELAKQPGQRYARMSRDEAITELRTRGAIFDEVPAEKAVGVVAPIRLTARLDGVHIHGMLPAAQAVVSPFEIVDARLALSLWDFVQILKKHDVDEIVHFSMFRPGLAGYSTLAPPALPKPTPDTGHGEPLPGPEGHRPQTTAAKGKLEPRRTVLAKPFEPRPPTPSEGQTTSRHPAGLAIDVGAFHTTTGKTLSVGGHFGGRMGAKTCGEGALTTSSPEAAELRAIVCEADAAGLFTYVLTPNFNYAHRDHFHMEIKAGVRWTLMH